MICLYERAAISYKDLSSLSILTQTENLKRVPKIFGSRRSSSFSWSINALSHSGRRCDTNKKYIQKRYDGDGRSFCHSADYQNLRIM